MNPLDISKLADKEKERARTKKEKPRKAPFNPLDWMDFNRTRKWMQKNLELSDRFYGYLVILILLIILSTWFWMDNWDESKWEFIGFCFVSSLFIISCIFGFIYSYHKAHNKKS
jgi:hypothetical protein